MVGVMYSGFWGPSADDYSILVNKMPRRYAIKRVVNRSGFRVSTELFAALIGAAPGGPALATHPQVDHADGGKELGKPVITTVTDISRATTADDVTALEEMVYDVKTRPSYPADRSGNGGPALT